MYLKDHLGSRMMQGGQATDFEYKRIPVGDAQFLAEVEGMGFNVADSKDTYQIRVKAKAGEIVQVNGDDATFVPAPVDSSKPDTSETQPIK